MTPPTPHTGANPASGPSAAHAPASPLQPSDTVRIWALVPCAGVGSRAGGDVPKQYQHLAGQAMLVHSLNAFGQVGEVAGTLLVLSPSDIYFNKNIDLKFINNSSLVIAKCGGLTRHESVFNGLCNFIERNISENDWVLVHDAARCLITPGQIRTLINACQGDAVGGLLALKVPDTIKSAMPANAGERVYDTVDRADKWLAQTPQMFRVGMLRQALQQARGNVTDESSAIEQLGLQPLLVQGSAQNFKVTYPEDFALADSILRARQAAHAHQLPVLPMPTPTPGPSYDYP